MKLIICDNLQSQKHSRSTAHRLSPSTDCHRLASDFPIIDCSHVLRAASFASQWVPTLIFITKLHYTLLRNDGRNVRDRFSVMTLGHSRFTVESNIEFQRILKTLKNCFQVVRRQLKFSETTQRGLTLIFENTQMIEDRRLTLTSLTSHLFVRHLTHIISSLDYLNTLISFNENPFCSKVFLFSTNRGLVAFPDVKFGNDVTSKNLNRK